MSHEIALQLTKNDGSVEQRPQPRFRNKLTVRFFSFFCSLLTCPLASLQLDGQRLTAVSNNIAELTHVTALLVSSRFSLSCALTPSLQLNSNFLTAIPTGMFGMTQLKFISVRLPPLPMRRLLTRCRSWRTTAWWRSRQRSVS
ncbi:MAG: hypothetical protein IV100_06865 [Myxococcales bacterium]|nr:hypothetical protein [Myxococcales bacterium]